MASFTDLIPQFNPYVQQLPVEAMVQVGTYKQQKYEEGLQKIQSQVDQIAGLDIDKPLHKQYLQSKLNELGNNLKVVAAGDFSNFQLVNSVGGMIGQIGKDPIVQNAVLSTQRIRQEKENIQVAQKAGKSSVNNEEYFYNQVNSWRNDTDLATPFSGEFVEYKDVDAKLRELAGKLKEEEIGIENPYMRDDQGRTLYFYTDPKTKQTSVSLDPSKGEKRLDLDMLSVKMKGLPAQKILNNFYDSLDSNDIRQLRIDSWAHYRNRGPESFKSDVEKVYRNKQEMLSQEKVDLAVQLQNPQITGVAKAKIEARLADINTAINNKTLEKEMNDDYLQLQDPRNLEDFKYKLYTQNYLTNLAKDISYQSYVQERKTNPAEQADLARKKFQFDQIQEANDMYKWKVTEGRLREEFEYKKLKDYADQVGKGYRVVPGDWKTGMDAPTVTDLEKDLTAAASAYQASRTEFAQRLYPSTNPDYANMTLDEKIKALDVLSSNYRKNPNMSLTPDQQEFLEEDRVASNNLTQIINGVSAARNFQTDFKKNLINDRLKNQTVSISGNTYTGEDIVDFNSHVNKFNKSGVSLMTRSGAPSAVNYFDNKAALDFYRTYKNGKLLPMAEAYIKDKTAGKMLSKDEEKLVNFSKSVRNSMSDLDTMTNQAVGKFIANNNPVYTVQRAAIDVSDPKKAKDLDEFLAIKAAQWNQKGGLDTQEVSQYSPTTSMSIRGEKNANIFIEKSKDGSANVVMIGSTSKQIIPAQASEVATYFPEVAVTSPFADLKDAISLSPTRTTNSANIRFVPGSGSGAVNAKISGYQLPQLKNTGYESKVRIDIEGSLKNTGNTLTDKYAVILYVPDPKTGMWKGDYVSGGYVSEAATMDVIGNISPISINQAIKLFK